MYVMKKSKDLWTVGYFDSKGEFNLYKFCYTQLEAKEMVIKLNSGL